MRKIVGIVVLCGLVTVVGCSKKKDVVARIGSTEITAKDFGQRLNEASYYYSADFLKTDKGKRQVLDGIVKEAVLASAARRQGLEKNADFKKAVDQLLVTEMIKKMKQEDLNVTDKDIETYYNDHQAYYATPQELKVAHILVSGKKDADDIVARLKKGEDFTVLAAQYSLDTASGRKGGELDWFASGDMVPEFEKAAFGLKNKGDVSGIVETKFGYHIIKLMDNRTLPAIKLPDVAPKIRRIIEKDKFDAWFAKEEKKQRIKINDAALNEVKAERSAQ